MEILQAVELVLRDAQRPFHYKQIAKEIGERKLVDKTPQTLETLVNAQVATELRVAEKENRPPRFSKLPDGYIALNEIDEDYIPPAALRRDDPDDDDRDDDGREAEEETNEELPPALRERPAERDERGRDGHPRERDDAERDDLLHRLEEYNRRSAREYARHLNAVDFPGFERLMQGLIRSFAVKRATVVNRRKDGGMDYAVNVGFLRNNLNLLVAVRRWGNRRLVTMEDVQETFDRMKNHGFNACVYVTTGDFDAAVYDFAESFKEFPFFIVTGEKLAWLMLERRHIRDGERVSLFRFEFRPERRDRHPRGGRDDSRRDGYRGPRRDDPPRDGYREPAFVPPAPPAGFPA